VGLSRPLRSDLQKKTAHASEQDREDVKERREAWFDSQFDLDPEKLVFIDETWTTMYGRAKLDLLEAQLLGAD
jgi:hypothetical protein